MQSQIEIARFTFGLFSLGGWLVYASKFNKANTITLNCYFVLPPLQICRLAARFIPSRTNLVRHGVLMMVAKVLHCHTKLPCASPWCHNII